MIQKPEKGGIFEYCPNIREPATGSLIPSISTGGAAMNATMKQVAAASRHGIIKTPNHPTYKRLSVEVTH